jgi:hypothetical protein
VPCGQSIATTKRMRSVGRMLTSLAIVWLITQLVSCSTEADRRPDPALQAQAAAAMNACNAEDMQGCAFLSQSENQCAIHCNLTAQPVEKLRSSRGGVVRISAQADAFASSFACKPDSVRREFGPMRHGLADSASTFAEPATR